MLSENPFAECSVSEIAGEVGRGLLYLLGFAGWVYFLCLVMVD